MPLASRALDDGALSAAGYPAADETPGVALRAIGCRDAGAGDGGAAPGDASASASTPPMRAAVSAARMARTRSQNFKVFSWTRAMTSPPPRTAPWLSIARVQPRAVVVVEITGN